MTMWTNDELTTIGAADELELTSLRRDGTLRTPAPLNPCPTATPLAM